MHDPTKSKIVKAYLFVIDGVLTCYSITKNVTFNEAMEAVVKMRDELNRQIENSGNCPFNKIDNG